jgi:hypothetical protein
MYTGNCHGTSSFQQEEKEEEEEFSPGNWT